MLITDRAKLIEYNSGHRVWQGIPGIARTDKGRIFVSFYSGSTTETYGNFAAIIKSDDEKNFSEPIVVAMKDEKFRCFDPVLWIDPLKRLWFIWNVMPGEEVMASICDDPDADELSWGAPFYIGRGIMMNKPLVLTSGEWLFPIAVWKLKVYEGLRACAYTPDETAGSFVYKTSDNGKNFIKLGYADIRDRSFDEHMLIELENGIIEMFVRTKYGIAITHSYDRGKNWSRGEDSKLGGPNSRFFIKKLKSGRVLLINHHNYTGRNNLTALLSEDDGKTFPYTLLLDERENVSYPDAMEGSDGYIYIVYDRDRGFGKYSLEEAYACAREVLIAKISEEDILKGALQSEGGYLKRIACKLGELDEGVADPYVGSKIDDQRLAEELINGDGGSIIDKVFERYPRNCINLENVDARQMDKLIDKFNNSGCKDVHLLTKIIELVRLSPMKNSDFPVIEAAKNYINDNLARDFSINDIADHLHVSVYYLSHLFKSVTGTTILEYRNELRFTQAKLMLIQTNMDITYIAEQTGFGSAAYFTSLFSKAEKIPPSEYRKYHKGLYNDEKKHELA